MQTISRMFSQKIVMEEFDLQWKRELVTRCRLTSASSYSEALIPAKYT